MSESEKRFRSEKVHLTYRSHMDMAKIKAHMMGFGNINVLSMVHENGDVDEACPTPYAHTHVAVYWSKALDAPLATCFDIDGVHPNAQTRRSMPWFKYICLDYHHGHKTKANKKKYFIDPVLLVQEGVDEWKFEQELLQAVVAAPSLEDACLLVDATPKSISDCISLRKASGMKRDITIQGEDGLDPKRFKPYSGPDYDPTKKSLVISGPPFIGKTQWLAHHYPRGALISELEDLRNLDTTKQDVLIFDDMEFEKCKMSTQKYVSDVRMGRTIRMRNINGFKPAMPAIFTTNDQKQAGCTQKLFSDDPAIDARVVVWDVKKGDLFE